MYRLEERGLLRDDFTQERFLTVNVPGRQIATCTKVATVSTNTSRRV